jgi:hypothetical protein
MMHQRIQLCAIQLFLLSFFTPFDKISSMLSVLVTGFNRPDLLESCLEELLSMQNVGKIYVHLDGPRSDRGDDARSVKSCLEISERLLFSREHEIQLQDRNLGGRESMQTAISWFFSKVTFGMVIEDDVRIHHSVPGILLNLEKIRSTEGLEKVGSISLYNPIAGMRNDNPNFQIELSNYPMIWGWCTWSSVWSKYSNEITDSVVRIAWVIAKQRQLNLVAKKYWLKKFYTSRHSNTWDTQLLYLHWKHKYTTVTFNQNLSTNIGFDGRATRTTSKSDVSSIYGGETSSLLTQANNLRVSSKRDRELGKKSWGLSYRNGVRNIVTRFVPRKKSRLEKFKKTF